MKIDATDEADSNYRGWWHIASNLGGGVTKYAFHYGLFFPGFWQMKVKNFSL